jgi:hypothetical protein
MQRFIPRSTEILALYDPGQGALRRRVETGDPCERWILSERDDQQRRADFRRVDRIDTDREHYLALHPGDHLIAKS